MKKNLLFLFILSVFWRGMVSPLSAETLSIGSGTDWNYQTAPINPYNNHSYTQTIYTKEELSALAGKKITAVSYTFKNTSTSKQFDFPVKVWIGTSDKTYFYDNWISIDELTLCYEGRFNPSATQEEQVVTWNFTMPYVYTGDRNLVIAVLDTERTLWSMDAKWQTSSTKPESRVFYTSVNNAIDPASPGSGTATLNRPNTVFTYEDVPETPFLTVGSDALTFDFIQASTSETKMLAVQNTGKSPLTIASIDGLTAPFTTSVTFPLTLDYMESTQIPVTYAPEAEGEHTQTVTVRSNGGTATVTLSGSAYPATALFEHFDGEFATPKGWRHVKNELSTSYESKSSGGVNDSPYIQVNINYGDTLVSPKVGRKITFYAKYHSDCYNNYESVLKVFTSPDLKTWTQVADLGGQLENNWKQFEIDNLPEDVYVGFYMYKASLDELFADYAVVPQNDILLDSFDLGANFNEQTYASISVIVYNWGYVDISARAYRLEVWDQASGKLLKNIEDTPALPVADTAYFVKDSLYITLEQKVKTTMQVYVKAVYDQDEDPTNNQTATRSCNVIPMVGELDISMVSSVVTPGKPYDFDIIAGPDAVAVRQFRFHNAGISPVTISGAEIPAPFTVSLTFPLSIPAKSDQVFTVSMQGEEGTYEEELVFTHDGLGDTTVPVKGIIAPAGYLLESFLSADEFPPPFWLRTGEKELRKGWERDVFTSYLGNTQEEYAGEKACAAQLQDVADTLISPKVRIKSGESLSFWLRRRYGSASSLVLLYSPDKENWQEAAVLDSESQDENLKIEGTFRKYEIAFPETGDFYIGFAGVNVQLDMIRGYEILYAEHDMAVQAFTGPEEGIVNYTNSYQVKFRNYGKTKESVYTVKLMAGDTELMSSTEDVEMLNLQSREFTFDWTPRESGTYQVYAKIELEGEENPLDNISDTLTVVIAPETAERTIQIGKTDDITSSYPMKSSWYYSAYESIYYADELTGFRPGMTTIRKISFPYYASADYKAATRIYMVLTDQQDLTEPIQASAMTKVFEVAEYTVPGNAEMSRTNPGVMEFVLDEPFAYTGGNLVVMVETNSNAYQTVNFFENKSASVRTRGYYSDSKDVPPANTVSLDLKKETLCTEEYPTLYVTSYTEPSVIQGIVKKKEKEGPDTVLSGAEIVLTAGVAEYRTGTDEAGNFSVTVYQTGREYEMIVSAVGCVSDTLTVNANRPSVDLGTLVLEDGDDVGVKNVNDGNLFCYLTRDGELRISAENEIRSVRIFRADGSLWRAVSPFRQEVRINFTTCEKGIYLVEIRTAEGARLVKVIR